MRDGVKHTRVAGVLFWNFHAGPPLGSEHLGAIRKKIAAFNTALSWKGFFIREPRGHQPGGPGAAPVHASSSKQTRRLRQTRYPRRPATTHKV